MTSKCSYQHCRVCVRCNILQRYAYFGRYVLLTSQRFWNDPKCMCSFWCDFHNFKTFWIRTTMCSAQKSISIERFLRTVGTVEIKWRQYVSRPSLKYFEGSVSSQIRSGRYTTLWNGPAWFQQTLTLWLLLSYSYLLLFVWEEQQR